VGGGADIFKKRNSLHGERAFNKCEPCVEKCTKLISLPIKLQLRGKTAQSDTYLTHSMFLHSCEGARSGCHVATCRVRGGSHETRQRVSKDVVEHGERSVDFFISKAGGEEFVLTNDAVVVQIHFLSMNLSGKEINRKRKEMSEKVKRCSSATEQVTLSPKRSIISKDETHASEPDNSFRQRYFATLRVTKIN